MTTGFARVEADDALNGNRPWHRRRIGRLGSRPRWRERVSRAMAGYGGREGPDTPGESRGVAVLDPAEDLLSPLLGDSSGDGRDEPARGDGGESARGDGAESAGGDGAESDGVASPHPSAFLRLRADDTDPIAGLTHRDAASRLRHFGANETPSPPPPDERALLLRELRTPAARVVWFALLLTKT